MSEQSVPIWPRRLALILVIFAVALLIWSAFNAFLGKNQLKETKLPENESQTMTVPTPLKFDFYTMLPKMAVSASSDKFQETIAASGTFYLQIATLHQLSDAEKLRNKMHDAGYPAFIQQYKTDQMIWYKVMLGPYGSLNLAQHAQNHLQEYHINAVLIK